MSRSSSVPGEQLMHVDGGYEPTIRRTFFLTGPARSGFSSTGEDILNCGDASTCRTEEGMQMMQLQRRPPAPET